MESKIKYKYLKKEKKKEVREKFKSTKYGKSRIRLLNRLFVEGLLCLIMGVVFLIYSIVAHMEWHYYGLSILLISGGLAFTITEVVVRYMEYDKYINDNKKKKRK